MKRLSATTALAALALAAGCSNEPTAPGSSTAPPSLDVVAAASPGTVLVVPTAAPNIFTQGWFGYPDRAGATGLASIGTTPATQTLGYGSLDISNSLHGWEVAAYGAPAVPPGTALASITALDYATSTSSGQAGITVQHVAVQFTIDYDLTDAYAGFQGRLVYEPYHCNTVPFDTWTTWNTLDGSTSGCWFQTANPANPARAPYVGGVQQAGALPCPMTNPCTWSEVMTAYPTAGFHATNFATGLIFKVGTPWVGTFYTDALVVGVSGNTTTYDFEPYDVAEATAECLKGGWQNVTRANGSTFKNQGDCVSYVQNGK